MTDTEILDYLQNDYTMHRRGGPRDVTVGRVAFTLGLTAGTLRDQLVAAIERDKQRTVDAVTKALVGINTGDPMIEGAGQPFFYPPRN